MPLGNKQCIKGSVFALFEEKCTYWKTNKAVGSIVLIFLYLKETNVIIYISPPKKKKKNIFNKSTFTAYYFLNCISCLNIRSRWAVRKWPYLKQYGKLYTNFYTNERSATFFSLLSHIVMVWLNIQIHIYLVVLIN